MTVTIEIKISAETLSCEEADDLVGEIGRRLRHWDVTEIAVHSPAGFDGVETDIGVSNAT